MSTTIDERVVEMRFDNKQFESNVATSMSTLDKLKQKLNLQGTSKGLEDLSTAAKKVDMSGLGGAVDSVKAKFSAMDVVAVTALANITNSAVNAGKNLVKSLSVDQVTAGWKKFSDKTTSVATLVAQGNAIEDVNTQLDRLNTFTDETSYNFTDMVSNIAKFTATGKGLEDSVTAMEGIANWAALSGQNASTASRAMYQLSQAMGAGVMRLEDYKSIQNVSMDTDEFRQKCLDAAVALETLKDNGDGTYSSLMANAESFTKSQFANSLTKGAWLTSDVMMKVFNDYSAAVAELCDAAEEQGTTVSRVIDEIYTTAEKKGISTDEAIKSLGYSFDSFALKAFEAAQKARTFQDAIDSVKDAVSTGWMNTFELIFGDAEGATKLWTDVANQLYDVFATGGERRNSILETTMVSGWDQLVDRVTEAGIETESFEEKVKACAKSGGVNVDSLVKKYGSLSDAFKNGAIDTKYLKKAFDSLKNDVGITTKVIDKLSVDLDSIFSGKDGKGQIGLWDNDHESVKKVQTALEELGFTLDKFGVDGLFGQETQNRLKEFQKSVGLEETGIVDQKTIDALKKAGQVIEKTGEAADNSEASIDDLLDTINRPSGRELIFDIIHNSLETLVGFLGTFRSAWADIFSEDRVSSGLYSALKGIRDFTEGIKSFITDEANVEKLTNSFKGLVAVFDVITSIAGGGVKFVFKSLSTILKAFNFDILGTTSNIGTLLVSFRNWVLEGDKIGKVVDWLTDQLSIGIEMLKGWGKGILSAFKGTKIFTAMSKAVTRLGLAFSLLKEGKLNFIDFVNEIGTFCSSIIRAVPLFDNWINSFNNWLESFKGTETFEKLSDAVTRLSLAFNLLKEGELTIFDFAAEFGTFISSVIDAIPILKQWKDTFTGWIESFKNLSAVQQFVAAIQGIKDAFSKLLNGDIDFAEFGAMLGENLGKAIRAIPNIIKEAGSGIVSAATQIGSDFIAGFKNGVVDSVSGIIGDIVQFALIFVSAFASALGVHSPSVIAYSIGAFFIAGFVAGLSDNEGSVIGAIKQLGEGITTAFKSLISYLTDEAGNIQWGKIIAGGMSIGTLVVLNKFANAFNKIAGAVTSFSDILKSVKGVFDEFKNTIKVFQKTLKAVNLDIIAGAAMKIAISVGILVASIWAIASITDKYGYAKLWNAVGVITVLCGIMVALAFALSKFSEANVSISKDGVNLKGLQTVLVQIGIAILLLAATAKLIGSMQPDQLKQGFIGLAGVAVGLVLFVAAMGKISKAAGDADVSKLGTMMLKISAALIVMVIAMKMISKMDAGDIFKGLVVLEAFVLFCKQLGKADYAAGEGVNNFGSNVLKIAVAMGILAVVMKMIAKMDPDDILKGVLVLEAFVILIGEMALINKFAGGATSKIGGTVMSMATSMMILAGTLWLLSSMDESAVDNGIRVMQKFVLLIAELTLVSQLGRGVTNIAANILAISTAIGILAGVAVVLSLIPLDGLAKGIVAVGMLGAIMSLMLWATRGANDVKGNIIAMTVAIGVMAAAVVALSFIDGSKLAGSVAALGTLMIAFGLMTKLAGKAESSWKMVGAFTTMMGVVIALTGVIVILSQLDPKAALPNAIALGILLTAFAGALAIMGHAGKISTTVSKQLAPLTAVALGLALILAIMNGLNPVNTIANAVALGVLLNAMAAALAIMAAAGKISTTVSKQLGPLTAVVFGLAIILAMMNGLEPGKAIANAIALGILLNLMATALVIMGAAGKISTTVSSQLGPLTAVVAGLAVILGIMAALNVEASIPTAIALGILLNALAAAMVILGFAGPNASKAVPAAMLMAVVLAEIAFVLGVLAKCEIQPSIETALSLSILLLAISAACAIVSAIPAAAAADGAAGLVAFIGIVGGLVAGLGALSKIPGFTELLADGGQALGLIGQAIGNFVGGIVNGVASGLVGIIPEIGAALAEFATNVEPFISLVSGIDSGVIAGAGILAGAIVALTAANFIAGLESLFSFGQGSFTSIGTQLAKFAEGAKQFVDVVKGIDPSAVDSVNSLSAMILALTATDILSGLKEFFGGGSINFEEIGTNLSQFGDAVTSFSEKISGKIDTSAIQAATDAGSMLVALNSSLPRSDGWVQDIIGEKDLSKFAEACSAFAEAIITINAKLSSSDVEIQSDKIDQLAKAGTQFSKLLNSLPKNEGVLPEFLGKQDLSKFAEACSAFAEAIIAINAKLSSSDVEIQSDKIDKLAKAGTQFSKLLNSLPKSEGVLPEFLGKQELGKFGTACEEFATCMIKINESVSGENFDIDLTQIEKLKQAGLKMDALQDALPKTDGWQQKILGSKDIGNFGDSISKFATAMSDFSSEATDIDTGAINLAIDASERIRDLVETLDGIDYSGVADFTGIGFGAGHGGSGADGVLHDIGVAISDFSTQVAEIKTSQVTAASDAAGHIGTLINALSECDTSKLDKFDTKALVDVITEVSEIKIPEGTAAQLTAFSDGIKAFNIGESDLANIESVAPSIETLSKAVTSWSGVKIPANLGTDLTNLAVGIEAFNIESTKTNVLASSATGIGALGDALKNWDGVTIPDGLGTDLQELGKGVVAFSFNSDNTNAFTSSAASFGILADSIAKWDGVKVPSNLGNDLVALGTGIQAFSFNDTDTNAFSDSAYSIGILATSIAKWDGVDIPSDLGANLETLATGIQAFSFEGSGENALGDSASSIGVLATSIAKWDGVKIPSNLGPDLEMLAAGIQAFNIEGSDGNIIDSSASSIGVLADSIAKWDGVKIPSNLGTDLGTLATGIQAFSFDNSDNNMFESSASGIGVLADSIVKWDGVKIPSNLGTDLGTLALGIKEFVFDGSSGAAETLTSIAPSIGTLADSVRNWDDVTIPDDIQTKLQGLAAGVQAFSFDGSDSNILSSAATGVGEMANSIAQWAEVSVPSTLGTDLSNLASGIQAFSFDNASSAADALNSAAPAIGVLANSIASWKEVTIPETLGTDLSNLATGVEAFNFDGESSLASVAPAVGTMADSIRKWKEVTIPETLGTDLGNLATGVKAFNFDGESSLASVAPAVGTMADSIRKWKDVTIRETLGTELSGLATGVNAFIIRGGENSLGDIAPAVGVMADSIAKWDGVTIRETLGTELEGLAAGIKKFNFDGENSLASVAPAVGTMADSIKNWDGVTIPTEIVGEDGGLAKLAEGIKKFTNSDAFASAATNVSSMADSIAKWTGVKIPDDIQTKLEGIAAGVRAFNGISAASGVNALQSISSAATTLSGIKFSTVTSGLDGLAKSITNFESVKSSVSGVGEAIVNNIVKPIENAKSALSGAGSNAAKAIATGVENQKSSLTTAGKALVNALKTAVSDGQSSVTTAATTCVSGAASAIKESQKDFISAGEYLGDGLVEGIAAKEQEAYDAGFALGQAAVQGEKDGQESKSPSKLTIQAGKWLGEGLVIGMGNMTKSVYSSGKDMGQAAVNATRSAMTDVLSILNSDVDSQPTIRPVVDLSDVRSGANSIGKLLNTESSVGVTANLNAVNTMMRNRQNGSTNDDVVSAINKLRKDLGNVGNTTYTVGNITYDDGSNVSEAVRSLVRAARVERRV